MRAIISEVVAPSTSAQVFKVDFETYPGTFWVRPASGNTFTVEYSADSGVTWNSVPGLNGASAYSEVQLTSGITHVRITPSGTQGGAWGIS